MFALIQAVSEGSPRNPSSIQAGECHTETETLMMPPSSAMVTYLYTPIFLGTWKRVLCRLQFGSTRQCCRDGRQDFKSGACLSLGVSGASALPFQPWMLCSNLTSQKSAQSLSRTHSRSQWSFPHRIHAVHTSHTWHGFQIQMKAGLNCGRTLSGHH